MDPVIMTLATILDRIGAWPLGLVICTLMLSPWIILIYISRGQEKRFDAVTRMYENNVRLVEDYAKLSGEQQDMIILNTGAITRLTTIIEERIP